MPLSFIALCRSNKAPCLLTKTTTRSTTTKNDNSKAKKKKPIRVNKETYLVATISKQIIALQTSPFKKIEQTQLIFFVNY